MAVAPRDWKTGTAAGQRRFVRIRIRIRTFRDRGGRVVPGRGERAHRQGQHELQRVPPPGPLARVRDPQQPLAQAEAGLPAAGGKSSRNGMGRDGDQGR